MFRFVKIFLNIAILIPVFVFSRDVRNASDCSECHSKIYAEWKTSRHALSGAQTNPLYAKMAAWASKSKGKETGDSCKRCHEPIRFLNLSSATVEQIANEGVTCDVCHATRLVSENSQMWFEVVPGNIKFGPFKDALPAVHNFEFSAQISESSFCLSCHSNSDNIHGVTFCSTGDEWQKSSFAKNDVTCQNCHMPGLEGKVAPLGKMRDQLHSHVFYGGYSQEMLNECADIDIRAKRVGNSVQVEIAVKNHTVGHALPTGSPMRMVILSVEAQDSSGLPVWKNYYQNPLKEDRQAVFMRLLQDKNGNAPVPPWEAVGEKFDRRLKADEERTLTYQFTDTSAVFIQADLNYRLAPPPLLKKLGITDEQYTKVRLITKKRVTID